MEKNMANLIRKFESYCAYYSVMGPNYFACKNALLIQSWIRKMFPNIVIKR